MSPLYEYRCEQDHTTEELRRYLERDRPIVCPECGKRAKRIISAHHRQPDGIYSHTPNIGNAADFERKVADADARAERTGTYKP